MKSLRVAAFLAAVAFAIGMLLWAGLAPAATVTGGMVAGATNPRAKVKRYNAGQVGLWAAATNAVVEETSGAYRLTLSAIETSLDYIEILWLSDSSDSVLDHYATRLFGINYDESTGTIQADDITSVGIAYWPGTGANQVTINVVTSGTNAAIPSAIVMIRNNAQTVGLARGVTNVNGQFVAALDNGTYKAIVSDYTQHVFTTPETLTVSGATSDTYIGSPFDPGAPTTTTACIVYGWLKKLDGTALAGKTVTAALRTSDYPAGYDANGNGVNDTGLVFAKTAVSDTTDAAGYWSLELTYSARILRYTDGEETRYSFRTTDGGVAHDVRVPSQASAMFDTLTTYTLTAKP